MKKGNDFQRTPECEVVFQTLKDHLGNPPLLSKLIDGETLIVYLAVSKYSISVVMVREEEQI